MPQNYFLLRVIGIFSGGQRRFEEDRAVIRAFDYRYFTGKCLGPKSCDIQALSAKIGLTTWLGKIDTIHGIPESSN